jgi:membrane associated rhomboid family serine protease
MSGILDDFKDAFAKRNNGLVQLIWLNVAVYVVMLSFLIVSSVFFKRPDIFNNVLSYFSLTPSMGTFLFRPWTILSYSFIHTVNPIIHLFPNMLMLYLFGAIIQEFLGSTRLINLYILGAFFGGVIALIAINFLSYYQGAINVPIIGASGSVIAIMFAASTLMPDYTFFVFLIGPVRIKYIALFFFLISLAGTVQINSAVNISAVQMNAGGVIVHLGGALLGYLYIKQLQAGRDWGTPIDVTIEFFQNLFKRTEKPSIKVVHRQKETAFGSSTTSNVGNAYPDDDEVDEILDKISRSGYESLTKEEKQKLFKASQK